MDLQNSDLIFVKNLPTSPTIYLEVKNVTDDFVVLIDIQNGGQFKFGKEVLQQLVSAGQLKQVLRFDLPKELYFKVKKSRFKSSRYKNKTALKQRAHKPKSGEKNTIDEADVIDEKAKKEMERRYMYVMGAIEQCIPAYTKKWLSPFITLKAQEIGDSHPPAWRTVAYWNSIFSESGSKKALIPKHKAKGNRTKQLPQEVHDLIDDVINEYLRTHTLVRYQKVYDQFLERLDTLNAERRKSDLVELKPCSYRWIVNRLQNMENKVKS